MNSLRSLRWRAGQPGVGPRARRLRLAGTVLVSAVALAACGTNVDSAYVKTDSGHYSSGAPVLITAGVLLVTPTIGAPPTEFSFEFDLSDNQTACHSLLIIFKQCVTLQRDIGTDTTIPSAAPGLSLKVEPWIAFPTGDHEIEEDVTRCFAENGAPCTLQSAPGSTAYDVS
jgi:hypothetical protein